MKQIAYVVLLFSLVLSPGVASAREIKVMTPPDPNSIPLMVLEAKSQEFLPAGDTIKLVIAPAGDVSAMKAIMVQKKADIGLFNFLAGGKFYSQGITNLRLAGIQVWGGIAILSKDNITPGDWSAMSGKTAISIPAIKTPPYLFAMQAAKKHGVDPKSIKVVGMGPAIAMNKMRLKKEAPDFVMVPEPLLSILLMKQEKENWEQKYHLFSDPAQDLSSRGIPLGAFWIIDGDNAVSYDEVIYGFEQAIDFVNNPANAMEVAEISSQGFKKYFGMSVPAEAFSAMLQNGLLKLDFREAQQVAGTLKRFWKQRKTEVDPHIFYTRKTYHIGQNSPFLAQMMPRLAGAIKMHGVEIGISKQGIAAAHQIEKEVMPQVITASIAVKQLELEIFELSLSNDSDQQLQQKLYSLAKKKLALAEMQADCVKKVFSKLNTEDKKQVRAFFHKNKNLMLNRYGFIF